MTGATDPERTFLEAMRVGRLATADAEGRPHVVPVCYALAGGDDPRIVTPIDEKPKETTDLRRVRDVRANPRVALVVDRYAEDWSRLGWVQVRGTAAVVEPGEAAADAETEGEANHPAAVRALRAKYDQYADHALEDRPVVRIDPGSVLSWGDLMLP